MPPKDAKQYYIENRNIILERNRKWRTEHPESFRKYGRKWRTKNYVAAIEAICNFRRLEPQCMMFLTPHLPTADQSCDGPLQIDHIDGGGTADQQANGSWAIYKQIASGRRDLSQFRLLCAFHNRWNIWVSRRE